MRRDHGDTSDRPSRAANRRSPPRIHHHRRRDPLSINLSSSLDLGSEWYDLAPPSKVSFERCFQVLQKHAEEEAARSFQKPDLRGGPPPTVAQAPWEWPELKKTRKSEIPNYSKIAADDYAAALREFNQPLAPTLAPPHEDDRRPAPNWIPVARCHPQLDPRRPTPPPAGSRWISSPEAADGWISVERRRPHRAAPSPAACAQVAPPRRRPCSPATSASRQRRPAAPGNARHGSPLRGADMGGTPSSSSPDASSTQQCSVPMDDPAKQSWANVVRHSTVAAAGLPEETHRDQLGASARVESFTNLGMVQNQKTSPPDAARCSSEKSQNSEPDLQLGDFSNMHYQTGISEQSRAFKSWARGRCYRCLAHGHQVRSCRDSFRCIHCRCPGHRARFCHLRIAPSSSQEHYLEDVQCPELTQSYQQSKPLQLQTHRPSKCEVVCGSLDSKSVVTPMLEVLRSELEQQFETHLERMMRTIREELSTIKNWLARVATLADCGGQEREHVSTSSIPELFGPFSPVRLPSASAILDSFAAACTSITSLRCEDKIADDADSALKPKAPVVEVEAVKNSSTSEILREDVVEETFEVLSKAPAMQILSVSPKKQIPMQPTSQAEDFTRAQDVSHDELEKVEHPIGYTSPKVADSSMNDSSSSDATTGRKDENSTKSTPPMKATRYKRQPYVKSLLHRKTHPARRNILKELGFIQKDGNLDGNKLDVFADVMKELLPQELLISLMKLEGHAFWEAVATILNTLF